MGVWAIVADLKIPVIDLHAIFRSYDDPLSLFPSETEWGHYNEQGNDVVANAALRAISGKAVRSSKSDLADTPCILWSRNKAL
jgi:hypothetical protein